MLGAPGVGMSDLEVGARRLELGAQGLELASQRAFDAACGRLLGVELAAGRDELLREASQLGERSLELLDELGAERAAVARLGAGRRRLDRRLAGLAGRRRSSLLEIGRAHV